MFDNAYALLIGVSKYQDARFNLSFKTVNDAKSIQTVLLDTQRCAYATENLKLLIDSDATSDGIRKSFEWLEQKVNSTADSTVVIFFSGHGDRLSSKKDYFLLPYNYNEKEVHNCNFDTVIHSKEILELVTKKLLNSKKVVIFFDCCHSSGIAEGKAPGNPLPDDFLNQLQKGEGRVVISACKDYQSSYILRVDDNSLFTKHLAKGLRTNCGTNQTGYVTVLQLFLYVNREVVKEALQNSLQQIPILKVSELDSDFAVAYALEATEQKSPVRDIKIDELTRIEALIYEKNDGPLNATKGLIDYAKKIDYRAMGHIIVLRDQLEEICKDKNRFGSNSTLNREYAQAINGLLNVIDELKKK